MVRASQQLDLLGFRPAQHAEDDVVGWRARLPAHLRFGTLGWVHPEWRVWSQAFDAGALEREGLLEYTAHPLFSTLALDLGPTGPVERDLRRYAAQLGDMPIVVEAPAIITLPRFPRSGPFASEGGRVNPAFLDGHHFLSTIWPAVHDALGERLALMIVSFPPRLDGIPPAAFAERLERFLTALPAALPCAVELREPRFLGLEHARVLATSGASHVFTSAPGMPPFAEQARAVPTPAALVVRLADPVGTQYASDEQRRAALVELLAAAGPAFVLIGDGAEGSAPRSIARLLERLARR